mmetsp:Transcript_2922/g.6994  ORF Transcript_2922/g.6994 Transcript_2922/m.6994 type:complete len:478 (-) Transcript_2922:1054-2487(-)
MMEGGGRKEADAFVTEAELQEVEKLFSEFIDEAVVMVDNLPKEQADTLMQDVAAHSDGLAGALFRHAVSHAPGASSMQDFSQISSLEMREAESLVSDAVHEANTMLESLPQAHAEVILQDLCDGTSELASFLRSRILKNTEGATQDLKQVLCLQSNDTLVEELEAAISHLMEKLPESYANIILEGIKHGQSPLCRAVRHQVNQRYQSLGAQTAVKDGGDAVVTTEETSGFSWEGMDHKAMQDQDMKSNRDVSFFSFSLRLDEIFLQMSKSIEELQSVMHDLKLSLREKERELENLKEQLNHLPVIRVMEILHADGTKSTDYQYNRLSLQDEQLMKMKREADESRRKAEEAAQEVERARREAAEEEFRFEAAKAEIRLEAFRAQQRKESQLESLKNLDKRRGAEPELMEGWIKLRRQGPLGGWQRKMLVLRSTGLLLFNDENRSGGCSNAFGLEAVSRFSSPPQSILPALFSWSEYSC